MDMANVNTHNSHYSSYINIIHEADPGTVILNRYSIIVIGYEVYYRYLSVS